MCGKGRAAVPRQRSVPGGEWGEPPWGPVVPFRCPSWGSAAIILHLGGGGHSAARCPPQQRVKGMGGGGEGPRPACFVLWGPQGGGVVQGLPQGSDLFPVLGGGGCWGKHCDLPRLLPRSPGGAIPPRPIRWRLRTVMHAAPSGALGSVLCCEHRCALRSGHPAGRPRAAPRLHFHLLYY